MKGITKMEVSAEEAIRTMEDKEDKPATKKKTLEELVGADVRFELYGREDVLINKEDFETLLTAARGYVDLKRGKKKEDMEERKAPAGWLEELMNYARGKLQKHDEIWVEKQYADPQYDAYHKGAAMAYRDLLYELETRTEKPDRGDEFECAAWEAMKLLGEGWEIKLLQFSDGEATDGRWQTIKDCDDFNIGERYLVRKPEKTQYEKDVEWFLGVEGDLGRRYELGDEFVFKLLIETDSLDSLLRLARKGAGIDDS